MARPKSPVALIETLDEHISGAKVPFTVDTTPFPYEGWQAFFQSYTWFRVSGMRRIMAAAGFSDLSNLDDYWAKSATEFPKDWIAYLPQPIKKATTWENLGKSQLDRAIYGKRIRFDAACRAIFCLEIACKDRRPDLDIYNPGERLKWKDADGTEMPLPGVKIRPCIYKIIGFDADAYASLKREQDKYLQLRKATSQWSQESSSRGGKTYSSVFQEISSGFCVTHPLAIDTAFHLAEGKKYEIAITNISSRNEAQLQKASDLEHSVYPWRMPRSTLAGAD